MLKLHDHPALKMAETPLFVRKLAKVLGIMFFLLPFLMMFLPWQQNIRGHGAVTAFAPLERRQTVDAPIGGMITHWHVQEGTKVKKGDLLLEISDIDPNFQNRLGHLRDSLESKLNAKQDELKSYQIQLKSLVIARDAKISAAQYKLDVAEQKALATVESIASAQATLDTAHFQFTRFQRLLLEGLVSKRDLEIAERDHIIAKRNLNSALAQREATLAEQKATSAEIQQIRSDTQASLDSSNGVINKIKGEVADSQNSLTSSEVHVSRQSAQKVLAPRDGTIFRLPVNSQSNIISQGQSLLVIVPDTKNRAVELYLDGRDAPLVLKDSRVRLEFEGWPAIQFSGWPDVAIGSFGGKVAFVDATDDGKGNFRVMVVPDETEQPWPSERFLRQGINARGWILLEEVSIGYELWRILNGFPPILTDPGSFYGEESKASKEHK